MLIAEVPGVRLPAIGMAVFKPSTLRAMVPFCSRLALILHQRWKRQHLSDQQLLARASGDAKDSATLFVDEETILAGFMNDGSFVGGGMNPCAEGHSVLDTEIGMIGDGE